MKPLYCHSRVGGNPEKKLDSISEAKEEAKND